MYTNILTEQKKTTFFFLPQKNYFEVFRKEIILTKIHGFIGIFAKSS